MFKSKATLARDTARGTLADAQKQIDDRKRTRAEQLLAGADAAAITTIDGEIAGLQHAARTEIDRIALLDEEVAHEEAARIAKRQAQHIEIVEGKMSELRTVVGEFQKTQAKAIKLQQRWHELAAEIAVMHPWGPGDQTAAGFYPDEVTRDTKYELCRIGSAQLGGAIRRSSFPGGQNPKLDWLHTPEKIPPLVDVIDDRHAYARKVLQRGRPTAEPIEEKVAS